MQPPGPPTQRWREGANALGDRTGLVQIPVLQAAKLPNHAGLSSLWGNDPSPMRTSLSVLSVLLGPPLARG